MIIYGYVFSKTVRLLSAAVLLSHWAPAQTFTYKSENSMEGESPSYSSYSKTASNQYITIDHNMSLEKPMVTEAFVDAYLPFQADATQMLHKATALGAITSDKQYGSDAKNACPDCKHEAVSRPQTDRRDTVSAKFPVQLEFFAAYVRGNAIQLSWQTSAEKNNDYFVVERSADGFTFRETLTHPGAGNSHQIINYQTEDTQPANGLSYYRLKQVSYDENFSYSSVVAVAYEGTPSVYLYPNIVKQGDSVTLYSSHTFEKAEIKYMDMRHGLVEGKEILLSGDQKLQGHHRLKPGLYTVNILINQQLFSEKILIKD